MSKTYRGVPVPDTFRDTYESYLWHAGVNAAAKAGFLRVRIGTLADRWRKGELIDVHATVAGNWYRFAVFFGSAPGSHMGLWHTDMGNWLQGGAVHGWNYRVGSLRRCVTLLAHTRKANPDE